MDFMSILRAQASEYRVPAFRPHRHLPPVDPVAHRAVIARFLDADQRRGSGDAAKRNMVHGGPAATLPDAHERSLCRPAGS
jgi:hypothetical protein